MRAADLVKELKSSQEFFDRSTRNLTEEDSGYTPVKGLATVAQLTAHIAQTIDWFVEGAFNPKGFDTNFEAHIKQYLAVTSLKQAREWLEKSYAAAIETIGSKSDSELAHAMPAGMIMGGEPRWCAILGIIEHTAHHRGALTVYTRMLGKVPPMPYMEM